MALRLPCPHCGERSVLEFRYGGEVPDAPATDASRNFERAWLRANAQGPARERWFHEAGCRRWVTLVRDTADDRVL